MNTITVYYNGFDLLVSKVVAKQLNLHNRYEIQTEQEFWKIIDANRTHNLLICERLIEHKN